MNKKDLIKCINESLEEFLPEDLKYNNIKINNSNVIVVETFAKGIVSECRKEFNVDIDFVGMIQ
jgi:hypothetical protein